jgi:hypothetical protein
MSTTTNITTTYAGELREAYIAAALLSGNTLANNGITVKPNIKKRAVIKRAELSNIIADASCDFTPTGTLTLTERFLDPKELQVNVQLCKIDFKQDWEAEQMGFSAHDRIPPRLQDYIVGRVAAIVAEDTEKDIWEGTASAGHFAGIVTKALADADVPTGQKITGAAGGVNAGNVIAEMGKVVDAMPSALYGKEDVRLYVSQSVMRAYIRALGGFGASGLGANGYQTNGTMWYNGQELTFDGVRLFMANGLAAGRMVLAQISNIWFGTGLKDDMNEVQLIDTAATLGDKNVRVIMRYTADVNYGISTEIVTYTQGA